LKLIVYFVNQKIEIAYKILNKNTGIICSSFFLGSLDRKTKTPNEAMISQKVYSCKPSRGGGGGGGK
jgi:hypothetical protein